MLLSLQQLAVATTLSAPTMLTNLKPEQWGGKRWCKVEIQSLAFAPLTGSALRGAGGWTAERLSPSTCFEPLVTSSDRNRLALASRFYIQSKAV